jgi:hypothetical protein
VNEDLAKIEDDLHESVCALECYVEANPQNAEARRALMRAWDLDSALAMPVPKEQGMKVQVKVVENIPLTGNGYANRSKYPWDKMKKVCSEATGWKGSSFFVPKGDKELNILQSAIISAAKVQKVVKGLKVRTKRIQVGATQGLRVWRVA